MSPPHCLLTFPRPTAQIPLMRDLSQWCGGGDVSRRSFSAALERENLALRSSLNKVLGQLGLEPIATSLAASVNIATAGEPKTSNSSSKNSGANDKSTTNSGRRRLSLKAVAHAARASVRLQKAEHQASQASL